MKKLQQLKGMADRLEGFKVEVMSQKSKAKDKLKELEKSFPRLLATQALGEVTKGEVDKVFNEMSDLKLLIDQAPLTVQGLEELERENNAELYKVSKQLNIEKATERYEKLKTQMGNEYDSGLDSELRSLAGIIGQTKEADAIISSWKNRLTQTPVEAL